MLQGTAELTNATNAFNELSRTHLDEVETGRRNVSIENIPRIADRLGVSLREFFASELFGAADCSDATP